MVRVYSKKSSWKLTKTRINSTSSEKNRSNYFSSTKYNQEFHLFFAAIFPRLSNTKILLQTILGRRTHWLSCPQTRLNSICGIYSKISPDVKIEKFLQAHNSPLLRPVVITYPGFNYFPNWLRAFFLSIKASIKSLHLNPRPNDVRG